MRLTFGTAAAADAGAIASLRRAAAEHLTKRFGRGHWSACATERGVQLSLRHARILIARNRTGIVGTLTLATRKPWAIDRTYFVSVRKALYLTEMAVAPSMQGKGVGRRLLGEAEAAARAWPADAIRLDAYDADAGAGGFYAKCGYREVGRVTYRKTPLIYYELLL